MKPLARHTRESVSSGMKRYPKQNEGKLARRVAKSWLESALDITRRGYVPASLDKCIAADNHYVWSHIYEFEHDAVGTSPDDGYVLSKAAANRVGVRAASKIEAALEEVEFYEIAMAMRGASHVGA